MHGITRWQLRCGLAAQLLVMFALSPVSVNAATSGATASPQASSQRQMPYKMDFGIAAPATTSNGDESKDGDLSTPAAASRTAARPRPTRPASEGGIGRAKLAVSTKLGSGSTGTVAGSRNDRPSPVTDANTVAAPASPMLVQDAPAAEPAETSKRLQTWDISPADRTLNVALARWAAAAGWQLVWDLRVDYAVETRTSVTGSFQEAVSIVANSMEGAEVPLKAIFYEGNKVLRITGKGNE